MPERRDEANLPLGHQYALTLLQEGRQSLASLSTGTGHEKIFHSFMRVQDEEPENAFLHSALCAMSLPARRPKDDTLPIIREDGKYALAINPKPVLQILNGKSVMRSLGVPFGSYPRIVLIYMLSEAVKRRSRDVYLGKNFTEWMRRLGYQTVSYGPRGSANLLKEQVDRLLACEWQIRWDEDRTGEAAFAVKEVKLSNEYSGSLNKDGEFTREISLSEVFFRHLVDHAVPLNEVAIRELKNQPTALDLYTYLAYRLPRVGTIRGQVISWDQLAKHLGNNCDGRRFRQTIRETFNIVSAVYPNAHADFTGKVVKLYQSPSPTERKLIGPHLRIIQSNDRVSPKNRDLTSTQSDTDIERIKSKSPTPVIIRKGFPVGSLRYGERERPFFEIGQGKGGGWDVDEMATAYRNTYGEAMKYRDDADILRSWEGFVVSYFLKRGKP
jgi:hypothetical protein